MGRNEAERRHFDEVKTARNLKILRFRWGKDKETYEEYVEGQEHRYTNNKVFCSCPLCAFNGTTRQEAKLLTKSDYDHIDDYFDDDEFDYAFAMKGRNRDAVRRNAF